jgi:hypothetical protein
MSKAGDRRRNSRKPNGVDKLLSFPGITQAISLVKGHAHCLAVEETMDAAARGELGEKLRELMNSDSLDAIGRLSEDEVASSFMAETEDEILEDLATEAGPKIAELWDLSEPAGERLSDFTYWGSIVDAHGTAPYWLPYVLVVKTRKREAVDTLRATHTEFLRRHAVVTSPEGMKDGHLYLDVTYLPYRALPSAYGALLYCREKLGIEKKDLREGALPSMDGEMALKCAEVEREKGAKEAARELGFRIYRSDNPSGSYPLFRKYLNEGRRIERMLGVLDEFLYGLEDNLRKT